MTADEMLQLLVDLVELDAELAGQGEEFLVRIGFASLGAGHVEESPMPALKRIADNGFGEDRVEI
jgi:hypothetical protein